MSARYATGFSVGALIWLSSLLAPEPLRYGLWALALLVEMGTPVLGYSTVRSVSGHVSHIPERFGLFTLIVLGESIVVLTSGVVETSWRPVSALTAVSGFTVAAYGGSTSTTSTRRRSDSRLPAASRASCAATSGERTPRGLGRHRHRERGDRVRNLGGVGA
jgi:hypothetical protein